MDEIFEITRIDRFFLYKLLNLVNYEKEIKNGIDEALYLKGKKLGYTDKALKRISGTENLPQTDAAYKMVDTCGAEFDAVTPYFYSTFGNECEARSFKRSGKPVIMVLGLGPIRIGQGLFLGSLRLDAEGCGI